MIDLHVHTTASDGEFSPTEIVKKAKEVGLKVIAITDHDTVDGVEEAIIAGEKYDIEVIPGIEISAEYEEDMHILGYYLDIKGDSIANMIKKMKERREERNIRMVEVFNKIGVSITFEDVKKHSGGGVIGKLHFAKALLEKGYVKEFEEAFTKYLNGEELSKIKRRRFSQEESIRLIVEAGGVPVLAHLKYLYLSEKKLEKKIKELKAYGLKGVECIYPDNTPEETEMSIKLAKKYDLIITGGTDFHGPKIDEKLKLGTGFGKGFKVPYELLEQFKNIKSK